MNRGFARRSGRAWPVGSAVLLAAVAMVAGLVTAPVHAQPAVPPAGPPASAAAAPAESAASLTPAQAPSAAPGEAAPPPAPAAPASAPAAKAASGKDALRLDAWTQSYAPNEAAPGWEARKFSPLVGSGQTYFYQFIHKGEEHFLHVRTGRNNSFSMAFDHPVSLKDLPVLEWEWKMGVLPKGGDVRIKEKDDQAGSMCFLIDPGVASFDSSLCYLFENDGPKDVPITSTHRDNARYLIVRTAKAGDPLNVWLHEKRNVLEDYRRVFGKEPGKQAIFGVSIDSNDTGSAAEAFYRNMVLHKP